MGSALTPTGPGVVVCAQDDPWALRLMAEELARRGLVAVGCATVAAAKRALLVRPALALIDLGLADGDGLDVLRELRRRWPDAPGVVVTVDDRPTRVVAALREGACGYVLKEDLGLRLPAVIDEALRGGLPLSPRAAKAVRWQLRGAAEVGPAREHLTAAETAVLAGFALGFSYEQCAGRAGITINTVRSHVRAIYHKLGVTSKVEAVLIGLRLGVIAAEG